MKLISFNINGISSAWTNGLCRLICNWKADLVCLQEIRKNEGLELYGVAGYEDYFLPSKKKGYAGVGVYSRLHPLNVIQGIGVAKRLDEGRAITVEYESFYIANIYAPAGGQDMQKANEKLLWMDDFINYISFLKKNKPVIICGDLNMPGCSISASYQCAGFSYDERLRFNNLLQLGYIDVLGAKDPSAPLITWAPYNSSAERGLRLDYFLIPVEFLSAVQSCGVLPVENISDHRPVELNLKI